MSEDMKTIMLADDDEAIVDATVLMLDIMGYAVVQTMDGTEIPAMAAARQPDLIMLDIWMSGVDGRNICRMLKADPATRQIPVLMISASRDIGQSAMDAGANDFIEKPFEMSRLLDKVEALLN
ncbi:response regulator transcription factor [Mucilaginibacter sp.]